MIPYGRQDLDGTEIRSILKVLKSNFLTQGPVVAAFEKAIARYCGAKYCVSFSSGTAALHAACHVAGLKKGLQGITSPLSFVASANCILYTGAEVVFADVESRHAQITLQTMKPRLTARTRVLLPVDLCGYPGDLPEMHAWAKKNHLIVIRDGTHSMGASYVYRGKKIRVGSCAHEDMCCFSFHPVKSFTTGEGGAVTTNNEDFYKRLKMFRHHGITKNKSDFVSPRFSNQPWYHEMQELGYNYRLSDIHCALGITQLKSLDEKISARRRLVEGYRTTLQGVVGFLRADDPERLSAHHILPILVPPKIRDTLMQRLAAKNIGTQLHYIPIYRQPYYRKNFSFAPKDFPNTENYFRAALSIPLFPTLTKKQQTHVINHLKEILGCL